MLVITMTTVGFGDFTPNTLLGRIAVGFASMIGIFLMALFISLVNEALMLKRREKRILAYVENQGEVVVYFYYNDGGWGGGCGFLCVCVCVRACACVCVFVCVCTKFQFCDNETSMFLFL